MPIKKCLWLLPFFGILFLKMPGVCFAQAIKIKNDPEAKKVVFGNSKIKMVLDYNQRANIGSVAYAYPLAKLLLMVISQTGNVIV